MSDATCLIAVSFKSLGNGRYVPDTELYTLLSVMGNSNLLMQDYMKTSSYKIGSYFFSSVQCVVEALALADGDRPRSAAPDELAAASTRPLFTTWGSASRDLAVACRAANIPRVSFNDLRRSWATWHVEAGVALDTLFRPMGHATPSTLARTYAKPSKETTADAMRAQIAARAIKSPKGDPEK